MNSEQFLRLLDRLDLKPSSKRAAEAFGKSVRQMQRMISGKAPVCRTAALLAIAYTKLGRVPDSLWNPDVDWRDRDVLPPLSSNVRIYMPKPADDAPEPAQPEPPQPEPQPVMSEKDRRVLEEAEVARKEEAERLARRRALKDSLNPPRRSNADAIERAMQRSSSGAWKG